MIKQSLNHFFKSGVAVGIFLFLATVFAMFFANSQFSETYQNFLLTDLFPGEKHNFSIRDFVNDGLMVIFFLLVGLELKKEIMIGELASKKKAIFPAIAAFGGVVFPVLIFIALNFDNEKTARGFAVPSATDIAFAYGVISLFGNKISNALKVFLVAVATIDDLIAILFIAFFYTENINFTFLALTLAPLTGLLILNLNRSSKISLYLILGVILWFFIFKSHVHATLAGVLLALFIPLEVKDKPLLSKFSHQIAPVVNFFILPFFAFLNAGVVVNDFSTKIFSNNLLLGTVAGLFFGKQLGITLLSFCAVKLKIAALPKDTDWVEFYGVAILTGIGFTMSLFIANLAFTGNDLESLQMIDDIKIGVLIGSSLSIIFGSLIIFFFATKGGKKNKEK